MSRRPVNVALMLLAIVLSSCTPSVVMVLSNGGESGAPTREATIGENGILVDGSPWESSFRFASNDDARMRLIASSSNVPLSRLEVEIRPDLERPVCFAPLGEGLPYYAWRNASHTQQVSATGSSADDLMLVVDLGGFARSVCPRAAPLFKGQMTARVKVHLNDGDVSTRHPVLLFGAP